MHEPHNQWTKCAARGLAVRSKIWLHTSVHRYTVPICRLGHALMGSRPIDLFSLITASVDSVTLWWALVQSMFLVCIRPSVGLVTFWWILIQSIFLVCIIASVDLVALWWIVVQSIFSSHQSVLMAPDAWVVYMLLLNWGMARASPRSQESPVPDLWLFAEVWKCSYGRTTTMKQYTFSLNKAEYLLNKMFVWL